MDDPPPQPAAKAKDDRGARLAEALRANLYRRKAQARAAASPPGGDKKSDQ